MNKFKYTLIAVATTLSFGINANIIDYDTYSIEDLSKIENSKFDTFIVKFKEESIHKDLLKDAQNNTISQSRIYGLNELENISYSSGLILKHGKSLSFGMDTLQIKLGDLTIKEIKEKLLSTGMFEFVEHEKIKKYEGFVNKKITRNTESTNKDLPVGKYSDPFWSLQTHFENREEPNMGLSNLLKAKDLMENITIDRKIKIAVLDSGSFKHEDVVFANEGYDFTTTTGQLDENGTPITKLPDDDPTDLGVDEEGNECIVGHGLAVSGLINATTDNAKGIVGVVDTSKVDIVPVRVGNCTGIADSDLIQGISWASGEKIEGVPLIQEDIDVINLSLGGDGQCSDSLQNAINNAVDKGIVVVIAAGNDAKSADGVSPANCDNVITVASVSQTGDISDFSNYGNEISVSAIGENWVLPYVSIEEQEGDQYGDWSGTSFSAPMVSALVATVKMKYPELNPNSIKELMERTAVDNQISQQKQVEDGEEETEETELVPAPNCVEKGCGSGLVDAVEVITALDDRTNVSEGEIAHKYNGYNSLAEAKYLRELDITTNRKSCDLYLASWGILRDEFDNITHRVYTTETDQDTLTSSNSDLQKIVKLPTTIIEAKPEKRVGVQMCEDSYCGEIFELELPTKDIPIYCESYISDDK